MGNDVGVAVLEVGGSHVTAAVVSPDGWRIEWADRAELDSRTTTERIVAQLGRAAKKLPLANGLVIALPGPFDYATGVAWYRGVEKFDALHGHDLGRSLRELLGVERIEFVNDAEAFAIGEWTAGTLRGLTRCVGVTIGTGVGTAFLRDGRAVRTGDTVPPGGELYRTSYHNRPLEDWISSRAIIRAYTTRPNPADHPRPADPHHLADHPDRAGGADASGPSDHTHLADHPHRPDRVGVREGVGEQEIGVKEIAEAARAGSSVAHEVLVEAFAVLSDALVPWLERFGATRVVLGGAISGAFDLVADVFPFDVTVTEDTEHSALIGAAAHFVTH